MVVFVLLHLSSSLLDSILYLLFRGTLNVSSSFKCCVVVWRSFTLAAGTRVKTALFDCEWDMNDDSRLLRGVYEHGLGNWDAVKMDDGLQLHHKVCLLCLGLSCVSLSIR